MLVRGPDRQIMSPSQASDQPVLVRGASRLKFTPGTSRVVEDK